MKVDSLIQASWFYLYESEKNKRNWFVYELACKLYEHIGHSRDETLINWRIQRSDTQTAWFCAYYAKRAGHNIIGYADDDGDDITTEYGYIRDYCHANTVAENAALLEACLTAHAELLESCVVCPVRCLEEMHDRCGFFDRMERGGYLS
jgi:hypothetical protein